MADIMPGAWDDVPVVLTATRLKQPRAEVPGSMTVIDAEQIQRWGVRSIPELLRFVPGMFVVHGDQDKVAYHASNPNLMRRMQVLVDGRSVYRAGVASVNWEDIPVALEDIQRLEVFRGPNASSYGANAFMAVINIVTFHPADTLGSRAYIRRGKQGVRDYQISHSMAVSDWLVRTTLASRDDQGFDGRDEPGPVDQAHDGSRDSFISFNAARDIDSDNRVLIEAGFKQGETRLLQRSEDQIAPVEDNQSGFIMGQWQHDFSMSRTGQLRAYWQREDRHIDYRKCAPTVALSPELGELYTRDPYWANVLGRLQLPPELVVPIASGTADPEDVEALLEAELEREYDISQDDLDAAQAIFVRAFDGAGFDNLTEFTCGSYTFEFDEQRYDIEWQDTVQWSKALRTVSGLSYRRDEVVSETYFNGRVTNDLFRVFANAEVQLLERLRLNLGGMYEDEDTNDAVFSPRVAFNYLIHPQQSVRLVYSTAVRSPDLLEQSPDYRIRVEDLDDNYLGLSEGDYFASQTGAYGDLDHERISSIELGYYARLPEQNMEWDVKLYRDRLYQLISNPINLITPEVNSDTRMNIKGVDWQWRWNASKAHSFWYSGAYVNTDVRLGDTTNLDPDERFNLGIVETRLAAEYSHNVSWSFDAGKWQATHSYFWHRNYNRDKAEESPYRRFELHLHRGWKRPGYELTADLFWHHIIAENALIYGGERYDDKDLGYLQLGVNF